MDRDTVKACLDGPLGSSSVLRYRFLNLPDRHGLWW